MFSIKQQKKTIKMDKMDKMDKKVSSLTFFLLLYFFKQILYNFFSLEHQEIKIEFFLNFFFFFDRSNCFTGAHNDRSEMLQFSFQKISRRRKFSSSKFFFVPAGISFRWENWINLVNRVHIFVDKFKMWCHVTGKRSIQWKLLELGWNIFSLVF